MEDGYARAAADRVGGWLDRVAENPEARRMVDARSPGLMDEARGWRAAAHAEARWEVRSTERGRWQMSMDGTTETRLSFGRSGMGEHYRLEASTHNSEIDSGWSLPFHSERAARAAGFAAEGRALGEQVPRPRDDVRQTPRGRHAELLDSAARSRLEAARGWGARPDAPHRAEFASRHKAVARETIARAATARLFGMDGAVASAFQARTPEMRSERRRSLGIER